MRSRFQRCRRARFELLEPRLMLAVTVNTLLDELDHSITDGDISLRDAIAAAAAGDTIDFSVTGTIRLTLGELRIDKSLTINGPDSGPLTIDASGNDPTPTQDNGDGSRVFHINDNNPTADTVVTINGLTITGGDVSGNGGAILNHEILAVNRTTITGNFASGDGGGIFVQSGRLTVGSVATGAIDDLLVGNDVVFIIDVSGSTLDPFGGSNVGDVNGDGSSNTILDAEISAYIAINQRLIDRGLGNTARIAIVPFGSSAVQSDMDLALAAIQITTTPLADTNGNSVRDLEEVLKSLRATDSTNYEDALVKALDSVTAIAQPNTNVIFLSDGVPNAGGPHADDAAALRNAGAHVRAFGVGQSVSLTQLQIIDPNAVTFTDPAEFIGAFSGAHPATAGVTISGNAARGSGGGIFSNAAATKIAFSTITLNTADADANSSGSGGGVFAQGMQTVEILQTIIAGNVDRSLVATDLNLSSASLDASVRFSLIGVDSGSSLPPAPVGSPNAANGNLVGTAGAPIDPRLGPLANNDGTTSTHALLPGSPAIGAGDPNFRGPPTTDQRGTGFPRIGGSRIDIGAFETPNVVPIAVNDVASTELVPSVPIHVLTNDSDADGHLDPTTVAIVAQPANGVAVVNPITGAITYTPNHGFAGQDTFTYTVKDNNGTISNIATVTIRVGTPAGPDVVVSQPQPLPPPVTPIDSPVLLPNTAQTLLLLLIPPAAQLVITQTDYGTDNYLPTQQNSFASPATPQAVDVAFGNDEVNEAFLLAGFLDFVEPEMLVVDLGDEPPAQVARESAKMSGVQGNEPAEEAPPSEQVGEGGGAKDKTDGAVRYMKPPLDESAEPPSLFTHGSTVVMFVATNWRWFASIAAAMLLSGAAWKSRSTWLQAARKLRSR